MTRGLLVLLAGLLAALTSMAVPADAHSELSASTPTDGTSAVASEVTSGDGHPVDGTLTVTATGSAAEEGQPKPMSPLLWLATLAVIGLSVFAVVKADRWRRKKAQAAAERAAGRAPDA